MKPFKGFIRLLILLLVALAGYGIYYAWMLFPLVSGAGAKILCTNLFVSGKSEGYVRQHELDFFPVSMGTFKVNYIDSSVTGSVWGLAGRKAIYRHGLGATLINDYSEDAVRSQQFNIPSPPPVNTDSISWPMGDKMPDSLPAGVDHKRIAGIVHEQFRPSAGGHYGTHAVIVVYDGLIVAEEYAPGFSRTTQLYGWSITKSITGALVGILVQSGKLDITAPAPVPEWRPAADPRHAITVEQLLQHTPGFAFEEKFTGPSDVTQMLFGEGDMAAFAAQQQAAYAPGTRFHFSSGNSNILSRMIRSVAGEQVYAAFPYEALFYKLGMYHTILEPDASGTYVGSSYMLANARDYARFGLLYYNNGVWNGEQLLPADWVRKTVTAPACNLQKNYGYQFWLNGYEQPGTEQRIIPEAPADMYYSNGQAHEEIYIIPSRKLVIVRLGYTLDKTYDEHAFLQTILSAVP